MKKIVVNLAIHDEEEMKKAYQAVCSLSVLRGIETALVEFRAQKLTVIGNVVPMDVVNKLKMSCDMELVSVEDINQEEKKKTKFKILSNFLKFMALVTCTAAEYFVNNAG